MSAPDTNMDKQVKRHRWPLVGIALSLIFVVLMTAGWVIWYGATTDDAPAKTDPTVMQNEVSE